MSLDINRVGGLLQICDLSKNWPSLRPIHDEAMVLLTQISTDLLKEAAYNREKMQQLAAEDAAVAQIAIDQANADAKASDDTKHQPISVDETHADLTRRI